jgi:hypothetical protein
MVPKAKTSRKQLFRAALAIAGMTAARWAESEGITAQYLSTVLNGKAFSKRLDAKIDAFVHTHLISTTAVAS